MANTDRVGILERQCGEMLQQLKTLNDRVSEGARREAQLRALLKRETELAASAPRLEQILDKPETGSHIACTIRRAELQHHPFPHAVIDHVLPEELYASLLKGLPPVELFSDRPVNKQHLNVPFGLAPTFSHRVWRFMATTAVPDLIVPAVIEKLRAPLDAWIASNWPDVPPASVEMHSSGGRLLRRQRGYRIPPHRDPKWGFITCILYLARRDDSETWGTQLYTVDVDEHAPSASPHWIDPARCHHVGDVAFRPNRMLILINSVGAHGAHIPADAQPEDLERYIYQFRIGPSRDSMDRLKSMLPEEQRLSWAGKSTDY